MLHKRPKSIGKRENGIDGFERAEKSVDTFSQNSRLFCKISRLFFRLVTTPYMNTGMWRHSLSSPTVDKLNYGTGGLLPTPNLSGTDRKAGGVIHPYSEEGATVADFRPSSGFHSCGLATLLSWSTGFFIAYSWIVVYLWVVEWCFIVKNLPIFEAVKRQG